MTRLAFIIFLPCVNALLPAKALRNGRRPATSLNILSLAIGQWLHSKQWCPIAH